MLLRLLVQLAVAPHGVGQRPILIHLQMARKRVPRLVGAGEPHLEKEGLLAAIVVDPACGRDADEDVAVQVFVQAPGDALILVHPVGVGVVAQVGSLFPVPAQIASPVVVCATLKVGQVGWVFDDDALVKACGRIARAQVHLAHVDAVIAAVGKVLYPEALVGPGLEAVYADVVRVHGGENGGAGGDAGGAGAIGLAKGDALLHEAVHVRCDHVLVAPRRQRIEALLVGDDQDDIRSLGHCVCAVLFWIGCG